MAAQPPSTLVTASDACVNLELASEKILKSNRAEYRPRADLARSASLRCSGKTQDSVQLLTETIGFAERYGLRLALIDLYLARADARAEIAGQNGDNDLKDAQKIHEETPYGLRAARLG